jgi:NAD(P)-dependent dehydrogenase (short-subunit alcohol dehydrogenase family)
MSDAKYVFITGAASGIGRATAERFAQEGWMVGAADLNEAGLASLQDALGSNQCATYRLDVTDASMFNGVIAEFAEWSSGRLDVLFNNAGIGFTGYFEDLPLERSLDTINVNLIGVIHGIYAALPLLKSTPNSLCFSTSSSAATYGAPSLAVYAATKFAVKGLTEALAVEFSRYGVRAADVLPGLIDTPILNTERYQEGQVISHGERTIGANFPDEGPFRLIPPSAVADAVWRAYHEDRLHWYVPPEIEDLDREKVASPEATRDKRAEMMRLMMGELDAS